MLSCIMCISSAKSRLGNSTSQKAPVRQQRNYKKKKEMEGGLVDLKRLKRYRVKKKMGLTRWQCLGMCAQAKENINTSKLFLKKSK